MVNKKIIKANALINNFFQVKGCNKKVMVMVKANAYGHGVKNVVSVLKKHNSFWGVANVNEALEVKRCVNKHHRILVVGKSNNFFLLIKNDIEFTIDSIDELKKINEIAVEVGKRARVHIKINTGMNRLGLCNLKEFKQILNFIRCNKSIKLCGVFTHLYDADCKKNHVAEQYREFKKYICLIKDKSILVHIGGSYCICNKIPKYINMVRSGFYIYGYGNKNLTPVMQIESKIIEVHKIKQNQNVGYGKNKIKEAKKIAVVPVGYADGLSRNLSNIAVVDINCHKCRIVGKICMDMFMVDITNINAEVGDTVRVFYDANYFAKITNGSAYEVLTNFSKLRADDKIIFEEETL